MLCRICCNWCVGPNMWSADLQRKHNSLYGNADGLGFVLPSMFSQNRSTWQSDISNKGRWQCDLGMQQELYTGKMLNWPVWGRDKWPYAIKMWLSHMQRQHLRSVIRQFPFLVCPFTRVTNEMLVQQHFSECWQECPLTLNSKRSALFYVQEPLMEPARWNNSSGDICTGQPARPVSSHFFLLSVGQSISAFSASAPLNKQC
jgi:hypothetical protein